METDKEARDMSIVKRVVEVNLNCDSCEFSTLWSKSIDNHRMVHTAGGEKLYECENCNFSTRWKRSLRRHVKNKHFVIDTVMQTADNEILEFLSQNLIPTPQLCNQSSPIRDTINYTGTADNTENGRSSSYTNNNFQNGISSSAVTSSNYQVEDSSNVVSKNTRTETSNNNVRNNCENVISSSIALNSYQGGSFFNNTTSNFQNGISSSYINNNFQNGMSSSVVNQNCQSEIGSNFVRNSCKSVISSSVASNNHQRTSTGFIIDNDNNFQNRISSGFINNNNCVNEVTSSAFRNNFQNGISTISVDSNYENVISSSVVSSNYQNTRRNSDSSVSNNVKNFDATLSTKSLSRPKPPSVENELMNPKSNIIVFVCELCGFQCSSADVCYNHAAEHQTNVFSPSWVTSCADVL